MKIPTIAVVEDEPITRDDLKNSFESPPEAWQKELRFSGFSVLPVSNAGEARRLIQATRSAERAIDILWLDLGLPENENDAEKLKKDSPDPGLGILEELRADTLRHPDWPVIGGVIVGTNKGYERTLINLIRTQLVGDFFAKPWDPTNREPFFAAVRLYRQRQAALWQQYKQKRVVRWLEEAARMSANRLSRVVTASVGKAASEMRMLTKTIEEWQHLSLTLDHQHPLCKRCMSARDSILQITKACAQEREKLFSSEETAEEQPTSTDDLRETAMDAVSSGVTSKIIEVIHESTLAATLDTSARYAAIVLEEMLFGAIDGTSPDAKIATTMETNGDGSTVAVSISDQGRMLNREKLDAIHHADPSGLPVASREWGLALAQYVALNVGCRLEVAIGDDGNHVSLHLPVAS